MLMILILAMITTEDLFGMYNFSGPQPLLQHKPVSLMQYFHGLEAGSEGRVYGGFYQN